MAEKMTLLEARRMRGVSQEDLALKLGLSVSGYRKKEAGESRVYLDEAVRICEALRLKLEDISFTQIGAENCTIDPELDETGEDESRDSD